jgi:FixJ family two-component response regulator
MNVAADNLAKATVFVAKSSGQRREAVSVAASAAGYVVQPVVALSDAKSESSGEQPSCVVADLPSVNRDSPELLNRLVESPLETPVELPDADSDTHTLVISSMLLEHMECDLDHGGVTFLRQPYTREHLLDAIRRAIDRDVTYREQEKERQAVLKLLDNLTERECEVMKMIYEGKANKVIASRLDVSIRTVENSRANIFRKLEVDTAVDLARKLALADVNVNEECGPE